MKPFIYSWFICLVWGILSLGGFWVFCVVFLWFFGFLRFFCENGNCWHMIKRKRDSVNTYVIFAYTHKLCSNHGSTENILHDIYFLTVQRFQIIISSLKRKKAITTKKDLLKSC